MSKVATHIIILAVTVLIPLSPLLSINAVSEDTGACDDITGPAKGLCYVYCEVMDCDSDSLTVGAEYCGRVYDKYVEYTGALPPCEEDSCAAEDSEACHR